MYSLMAETQHGIAVKTYDVRISSDGTKNARCHCYETDTVRTIDSGGSNPDSNHGGVAICEPRCYSIDEKMANTLAAIDYKQPQAVVTYQQTTGPLMANSHPGSYTGQDAHNDMFVANEYIVRRLTPLECSRLQGFPDAWVDGLEIAEPTEEDLQFWREVFEMHRKLVTGASKPKTDKQIIKWLQEPHNDGAEYKMWGNGIALPCFLYVMEGIKEILERTSNKTIH